MKDIRKPPRKVIVKRTEIKLKLAQSGVERYINAKKIKIYPASDLSSCGNSSNTSIYSLFSKNYLDTS